MPSSANSFDDKVKVYRYTKGVWKRDTEQGARVRDTGSVDGLAGNDPEARRQASEGDVLVCRESKRSLFINRSLTEDVCGLYFKDSDQWHRLYWRSKTHGHKAHTQHIREQLNGLIASQGAIALDQGIDKGIIVFETDGSQLEYISEEYWDFPDDDAQGEASLQRVGDYEEFKALATAEEQRVESIMVEADKYVKALQSAEARSLLERVKTATTDDARKQIAGGLNAILEEAVPSPASSGVTGVNDTVQTVNDMIQKFSDECEQNRYFTADPSFADAGAQSNLAISNSAFTAVAAMGSMYSAVKEFRDLYGLENMAHGTATGSKQLKGERNITGTNASLAAMKSLTTLNSTLTTVSTLSNSSAFSLVMQGSSKIIGPAGVGLSAFTSARSLRKYDRARARQLALKTIMNNNSSPVGDELKRCAEFLIHKVRRRQFYQGSTSAVAGISCAGGICLTVAAAGAANAWNPVGWVLLGSAAAGGLGLTGYKVYRRMRRKSRHEERAKKAGGEKIVDAQSAALALVRIFQMDKTGNSHESKLAAKLLETFGVTPSDLNKSSDARKAAIAMIVRHAAV